MSQKPLMQIARFGDERDSFNYWEFDLPCSNVLEV